MAVLAGWRSSPGRGRTTCRIHIQKRDERWMIVDLYRKGGHIRTVPPPEWPHDLRRTCARLCHVAGGELEQIQFLLGHVSVQTTEKYLGCKQKLRVAVNDHIGIEPED